MSLLPQPCSVPQLSASEGLSWAFQVPENSVQGAGTSQALARDGSHPAVRNWLSAHRRNVFAVEVLRDGVYWPLPQAFPFLLTLNTYANQYLSLVEEILPSSFP